MVWRADLTPQNDEVLGNHQMAFLRYINDELIGQSYPTLFGDDLYQLLLLYPSESLYIPDYHRDNRVCRAGVNQEVSYRYS